MRNLHFEHEMRLLNRPTNGIIVAKNSDLEMLCTLFPSLSANCKNATFKLTPNTSGKVIATNGSEVCKIGHHYPVLTPPVGGGVVLRGAGGSLVLHPMGVAEGMQCPHIPLWACEQGQRWCPHCEDTLSSSPCFCPSPMGLDQQSPPKEESSWP